MKLFYPIKLSILMFFALCSLTAFAQTGSISGKIIDDTKLPIPGASVQVDGTQKLTVTDSEGNFRITGLASGTYTLTAKYIGFTALKLTTTVGTGNTVLNFNLKSESQNLNEVIVVGYGTQTKREVTGAISKVSGDKLTSLPTPSFEASLQGQAPGVQVTQGSGLAGSGSVIRIRGIGSISAGGDPLYVVDGIPVTSDPFITGNRGAMNSKSISNY
ncbi:carboxypeptidase-like regulatory domain-containing protein [Pedobacter sp. UC225_61]|uniref:carboxypeptidase-like regulatory domain-containing protein n=1 Tax=Pedobacter sp. UC225_61 TaxID=3374623 RepID=UPI0037AE99AC